MRYLLFSMFLAFVVVGCGAPTEGPAESTEETQAEEHDAFIADPSSVEGDGDAAGH